MEFLMQEEKTTFKLENEELIEIPTQYYPMPKDSILEIQYRGFTPIRDARILRIIDETSLKIGRCFENSHHLCTALKKNGYDARYFTGWLFPRGGKPIFHAWVILLHDGEKHFIDSTFMKILDATTKKLEARNNKKVVMSEDREDMASLFMEQMKKKKRNTDRIYSGTPISGSIYFGSESTKEEAFTLYQELIKLKDHPSYQGGMKLGGDSLFQTMVRR